jgi:uncharacterized protein (DUF58 family)
VNHLTVRILAIMALFILVVFIPGLAVVYTDRFRRTMSPDQYAAIFAAAAVAGIFLFVPAISIVAATALLALGLAWFSGYQALRHVEYERILAPDRLFPGDETELLVRFKNDKFLPLAWLRITDPIQYATVRGNRSFDELLTFSGGVEIQDALQPALVNHAAIGPYQELRRTYRIKALQRGVYKIGPTTIESGDPFGIFHHTLTLRGRSEMLVYPTIYGPEDIGLPFRQVMGTLPARHALFEDPTLLAGSREYRPGDPLRHMHWKATARTGDLQVRVSDPSTTAQLQIILNLNALQHVWQGVDLQRMEAVISVAGSIALWALERDFAVGIRSNGIVTHGEHAADAARVAPSANAQQATVLLEYLARISFVGSFTASDILLDESRRLGASRSIIFVTAVLSPDLIAVLTSRQLSGRVSVVYCGRHAAPMVRGLPVYLAAPPLVEDSRAVS